MPLPAAIDDRPFVSRQKVMLLQILKKLRLPVGAAPELAACQPCRPSRDGIRFILTFFDVSGNGGLEDSDTHGQQ